MSKHRLDDAGLEDFLVATERGPREPLSDWWPSFKYRFTPEQLHELGLEVRRGRGLIEESVHEIKRLTKERDEARAEVTRLQNEQWDTTAVADCHHCPCFEGEHYTCHLDGHDCQGITTNCPLRKGPVMLRLVLPREEKP